MRALRSRLMCLEIYAWHCVHVHVFGPTCCVSVGMCVGTHVNNLLIRIYVYICFGIIMVSTPKLVYVCKDTPTCNLLSAYVFMQRATHVDINIRRHLGMHATYVCGLQCIRPVFSLLSCPPLRIPSLPAPPRGPGPVLH